MGRTFATSRLSSNGQTVIPKRVRRAMGIEMGSIIRYERDGPTMRISKLDVVPNLGTAPNPFANFTEWNEAADAQTFQTLQ